MIVSRILNAGSDLRRIVFTLEGRCCVDCPPPPCRRNDQDVHDQAIIDREVVRLHLSQIRSFSCITERWRNRDRCGASSPSSPPNGEKIGNPRSAPTKRPYEGARRLSRAEKGTPERKKAKRSLHTSSNESPTDGSILLIRPLARW